MITLESLAAVRPSTYNPRAADPRRLDVIELSLRKLGFLAPIFADADGEILSGHQRHHVAARMGATQVPVFHTKAMPLNQRKALNIVFNRATTLRRESSSYVVRESPHAPTPQRGWTAGPPAPSAC